MTPHQIRIEALKLKPIESFPITEEMAGGAI